MNVTLQFLGGVMIAIVTGFFTVLSQRYIVKSSTKAQEAQASVDQRKVDQASFDMIVGKLEAANARTERQVQMLTHQQDQTQGWLSTAVSHIRRQNNFLESILPLLPEEVRVKYPRVPTEITRLPQWWAEEEQP